MNRVLDRDPTYLRTPLVALIAALALVVPTAAFASDDLAAPPPPEAAAEEANPAAESVPPAGEEAPLPPEQSEPPALPAEEIPPVPDPVEQTPAPAEETLTDPAAPPASGDSGGQLPVEGGTSPEVIASIEPDTEPETVLIENPEPLPETAIDPAAGELIFPVAPAPDSSPPIADLSPEEIAPAPAPVPEKPAAPAQPPQAEPPAPIEPSVPVASGDPVEPIGATVPELDLATAPALPIPAGIAPDPQPVGVVLLGERLPEPAGNPSSVRPLVIIDPPPVVEPEPVLIEPATITSVTPEVVASQVPVPPLTRGPTEDPILFPTSIADGGEAEPPRTVALEIPFETSGAPPPASSSASASSSSSSGAASGVGPAALAALFVVIALGAAATVRLTTQAWRSNYLLSLPERPG